MMPIITDIRAELLNDSSITAIIGSGANARMYQRNPVSEPTQAYVTYSRQSKQRDDVRQIDNLRITCFSKDLAELENLSNNIINNLDGKLMVNSNMYHIIRLINQSDSEVKLESGFYWNMLQFEFHATT